MKSLVPWVCLLAASASQQAFADDTFHAYRLGKYINAASPLLNETGKDAVADYYLGRVYLYGYGQLKNTNLAIRYFTKSAEKGYLPAILVMAKYNLFAEKNPEQAVRWFKKAADADDVSGQMFVAAAYLFGVGVKQNSDTATKYYIDAAKNGNAIAQYTLADNFLNSRYASNVKLGLIWLTKSAANGNTKALTKLAGMYATGTKLVDKDTEKAKELLNEAIAKNYLPAMLAMGDLALSQNEYQQALKWYNKAASAHDAQAYLRLAHAYLQAKSPVYDANAGFLWTLKAAQEGITEAKSDLAQLYEKGIGVAANAELAKQWTDQAAEDTKKKSKLTALSKVALWVSDDATDKLSDTSYQMGGIFSSWQNQNALKDNIYNEPPLIQTVSRSNIFQPQFTLTQPNDVPISSYYDALNTYHVASENNQWTYPSYPLNRHIQALEKIYSLEVNKLNRPVPYKIASHFDDDEYMPTSLSLIDLWTEGWEEHANYRSVFNHLYNRAILGDAQSQFQIGQMFQYGLGVDQSADSAVIFYQNAAQQGHLGAEYNLGILYLQNPQDANSYQSALNWLTDSAFKGNKKAQYVLARVLKQGRTGPDGQVYIQPNEEQALSMLYLAAANNYGPAQFDLAERLAEQNDNTLSIDSKKHRTALIRQLYQGAANNGIAQALLPLAYYNAMDSDQQKQAQAFEVAKQQAEEGDDKAALLLGLLYDRGIGTEPEFSKAIYWYQHAGQNPVSDFILGTYTAEGKGVSEDKEQGLAMLKRSAGAKFSYGDFNLAVLEKQTGENFLPSLITAYTLGNSHAGIVLADYYISSNTDAEKMNQAKEIFAGLADKGDQYAQLKLGFMLDKGLGGAIDYSSAQAWYTSAAQQGNPMAQYLLGQFYQVGIVGAPDYGLAKKWYKKAAKRLTMASVALGFIYETVDDNYPLAFSAYQKAAEHGDVKGSYDLGLMYLYGKGMPVDYAKAKDLFTVAADKGLSEAMTQLGTMNFLGVIGPRNDNAALAWYKKSAELGNVNASYEMGVYAENGIGMRTDLKEALTYYQAAADKGNEKAMLALARMYQNGLGVEKDLKRSAELYEKLAEKQNAFAQYQLGTFYLEGIAGERSPDKGKQLLEKASENGSMQARKALKSIGDQKAEATSTSSSS